MIVIPTSIADLPSEPLSVEPILSVLIRKYKNPKEKIIRPHIRILFKIITGSDEPPKKKPKPIFASEI